MNTVLFVNAIFTSVSQFQKVSTLKSNKNVIRDEPFDKGGEGHGYFKENRAKTSFDGNVVLQHISRNKIVYLLRCCLDSHSLISRYGFPKENCLRLV